MSIVSITDTKGTRAITWSGQAGRQYTLEILIITSTAAMGPRAVLTSLGLSNGMYYRFPFYSGNSLNPSPSEWDYASFIQSLDLKEEAPDGMQWRGTMQFGPFDWTNQGGFTGSGASEGIANPFAVPPQVRWSSAKYEKTCTLDIYGNPIVNTVGDPFDPPIKRDDSRPILTIVQNQISFQISSVQGFKDTVNLDAFCGFPPNSVKCVDITAERQYSSDWGYYWQVTYEFEIRPVISYQPPTGSPIITQNGWTESILNAGYRYASVATGTPQPVMVSGAPVSSPVCLTQAGQYVPGNSPYYLAFDLYPQSLFAGLPIDQTILTVSSIANPGGLSS